MLLKVHIIWVFNIVALLLYSLSSLCFVFIIEALFCISLYSDYKKVRMYVHTCPFNGVLVGVERTSRSASIIVFPVSGISQDILEAYFENKKRSGGGDIKRVDLHETQDYAIIEFSDYTGMLLV